MGYPRRWVHGLQVPGDRLLGLRRLRIADVDYIECIDDCNIKNNAAVALLLAATSVQGHHGVLSGNGASCWPSLP